MMNNMTYGYNCARCGQWLTSGAPHYYCNGPLVTQSSTTVTSTETNDKLANDKLFLVNQQLATIIDLLRPKAGGDRPISSNEVGKNKKELPALSLLDFIDLHKDLERIIKDDERGKKTPGNIVERVLPAVEAYVSWQDNQREGKKYE